MTKHALPEDSYDHRIGPAERGVSTPIYFYWGQLLIFSQPTSHAACDCRSYSEHFARQDDSAAMVGLLPCPGPLATIFTERHQIGALAANQLSQRFPWVDASVFYANMLSDRTPQISDYL